MIERISFATKFLMPIREHDKTSTLRFNLNEIPETGSIVQAITYEGDIIGDIRIIGIETLQVKDVPNREFKGHENYETVDEVITSLNEYYHDTITPDSDLTLIKFELVSTP